MAVLTACSSFKGEGPHYDDAYASCYDPCSAASSYTFATTDPYAQAQAISGYSYGDAVQPSYDYSQLAHGQVQYSPEAAHQTQAVQYHTAHTPHAVYPDTTYGGYAQTGYDPSYHHTPHYEKTGPLGLRGTKSYIYGNLGGIAYDVGDDGFGVVGRLGYQSPYYVGTEVEATYGVSDSESVNGTDTVKGGVDYSVAAFALARLPLGDRFAVHARGGYHVTKIGAELDDGTTVTSGSESFDGFAYGAGAEFNMSPKTSVRVDYTRYELDAQTINSFDAASTDTVSLAIARKF
jgi:opacity protein-like surface antigen